MNSRLLNRLVPLLALAIVLSAWRAPILHTPPQDVKPSFTLQDSLFEVGAIYRPSQPILFDYDKATVLPQCLVQLDSIADFLVMHPQLTVEVGVHVDTRASDALSRRLDQVRANQVRGYISAKGVHSDRLTAKGYWNSAPLIAAEEIDKLPTAQEKEAAHAVNRRTEFKITGVDYMRK